MNANEIAEAEALKNLGLDKLPPPRYEVTEEFHVPSGSELVNFHKAIMCFDAIETAAFEKYIPDSIVINQAIDVWSFKKEYSRAFKIPAYGPIPGMSSKVTHATGITADPSRHNRYIWLAVMMMGDYDKMGATASSQPIISVTRDYLFVIYKLDFKEGNQASFGLVSDSPMQKLESGKITREEYDSLKVEPGTSLKKESGE